MPRHAYLIIAHNEFAVLNRLLEAIDDERNDIYLHVDRKADIPQLYKTHTNLFVVKDRINVCWGDYSQIEAELKLFECAYLNSANGEKYQYYHLISGVDFPLKSQNYIHDFCDKNNGMEFIGFYQGDASVELTKKVRCYHLFSRSFTKERCLNLRSILRSVCTRMQFAIGGVRNKDVELVRGTNWVSVTNSFVSFLLSHKEEIRTRFRMTFCADEVYKHTLCWNSAFRNKIFNEIDESKGCMREIGWVITPEKSWLPSYTMSDLPRLINSDAFFARKFSENDMNVIDKLSKHIKD